jgi:GAF domain-containing protein
MEGTNVSPQDHDPSAFLQRIIDETSVAPTPEQITEYVAQTFDTPFTGFTLIRDKGRRFETVGPTADVVRQADQLQHELREGPCVDAATQSRTLVSNNLTTDDRWPRWAPRVAGLGLGSILSTQVHAGGGRIGALNIYGAPDRNFTSEDIELAHILAGQASVALRVAQKIEHLTTALDSRTVIGQAQGILMHQYGIDADRAFAVLKRLSQDRNVRLLGIAQEIVQNGARPVSEPVSPTVLETGLPP